MTIAGLQKLTLLDYPGRVACTVFLNGCNFCCPFCHNGHLLGDVPAAMDTEELLSFLTKRKGILDGVCITGGEPTIHPELPELLRKIRMMDYKIKLDTNGYRPDVLRSVVEEGLVDYVAMDIKNSPEQYSQTVGMEHCNMEKIEGSICLLMEERVEYEFRTTVVKPFHTERSISSMCQWLRELGEGKKIKHLFVQPFVDRETVPVSGLYAPEQTELETFATLLRPCAQCVELRGT